MAYYRITYDDGGEHPVAETTQDQAAATASATANSTTYGKAFIVETEVDQGEAAAIDRWEYVDGLLIKDQRIDE